MRHLTSLLAVVFGMTACCDRDSIPAQTQKLYSPVARDRNDAALALAKCGEDAGPAVDRLIQLLYDENVGVQSASAYALRKIDTPEAAQALEDATNRRRK